MRHPPQGPIHQLVEEFLAHVKAGHRTRWTQLAYAGPLHRRFAPFVEAAGAEVADDLTPQLMQEFAQHLQDSPNRHDGKPLSRDTIRTYSVAVRQFLSYLEQQRGAEVRPDRVPLPPSKKVEREILTREEIAGLETHARQERDKLIIRLMGDYGMRQAEVVSIRVDSLIVKDRTYHFVHIPYGKTGGRLVPILPNLTPGLFRRLQAHARSRPHDVQVPHLFLSDNRYQGEWRALGVDGVYRLFVDASERMGFPRRSFPHLLRHSAITWLIAQGVPEIVVAEICGVSINTIRNHYWHSSAEQNWRIVYEALAREQGR